MGNYEQQRENRPSALKMKKKDRTREGKERKGKDEHKEKPARLRSRTVPPPTRKTGGPSRHSLRRGSRAKTRQNQTKNFVMASCDSAI